MLARLKHRPAPKGASAGPLWNRPDLDRTQPRGSGAEYVLNLLPRGTHEYARFIRPSEMEAWARAAGLTLEDLTGMSYNPLTQTYSLGRDVSVNYLACFRKA